MFIILNSCINFREPWKYYFSILWFEISLSQTSTSIQEVTIILLLSIFPISCCVILVLLLINLLFEYFVDILLLICYFSVLHIFCDVFGQERLSSVNRFHLCKFKLYLFVNTCCHLQMCLFIWPVCFSTSHLWSSVYSVGLKQTAGYNSSLMQTKFEYHQ